MSTENLPEMISLSKVGEHLTEAILIALLTAVLNGLNVGDNLDHVLLQDVALARQVTGALSRTRDAVVARNHMVLSGLREEGACSGKDMSLRGHPG